MAASIGELQHSEYLNRQLSTDKTNFVRQNLSITV